MNTTINEIAQIGHLEILMALVQVYLELNLPVTDAILAAEADLVAWRTFNPVSRSVGLSSRPIDERNIQRPIQFPASTGLDARNLGSVGPQRLLQERGRRDIPHIFRLWSWWRKVLGIYGILGRMPKARNERGPYRSLTETGRDHVTCTAKAAWSRSMVARREFATDGNRSLIRHGRRAELVGLQTQSHKDIKAFAQNESLVALGCLIGT